MSDGASIQWLRFRYLSDEKIRARSVVEVTETGKPNSKNGLNDPRMGINKRGQLCPTCRQRECSGHIGHIELGTDIIRFGAGTEAKNVLRCVCEHCFRPRWLPVPSLSIEDILEPMQGEEAKGKNPKRGRKKVPPCEQVLRDALAKSDTNDFEKVLAKKGEQCKK